ncbi:sensor histidine kinase [Actinospongicola halichondriae]|uniref:sensor histidine kinase n=1 Tax=Actinospongicola halichondriae TaxID=3236844 RepID=UPI003D37432D
MDSVGAETCVVCGRPPPSSNERRAAPTAIWGAAARIATLESALEQRDRMLSMVIHDLRNPLVAIDGHVGLLVDESVVISDEERQDSAQTVQRQIRRIDALIEDLLAVQTIDADMLRLMVEPIVLLDAVESSVTDCGLDGVELDIDRGLIARVDRRRLAQILGNLLANAEQCGAPPIVVSATRTGDRVALVVRDHGLGVPDEFIPVLFDRFSQASRSRHPSKRGTGLGLSIARDLARAMGGDLEYEPGDGGCFRLTLPG